MFMWSTLYHRCALVISRLSPVVKYVAGVCGQHLMVNLYKFSWTCPCQSHSSSADFTNSREIFPLHMHVWLTLCFASHTDQWWGAGIWPGPLLHTKALRLWPREGLHTTWTHLGQVEMFFPYFLLQFYSHGCVTCPVFALCTESCENAAFCFRPTSLACSLSLHSGFSLQ